MIQPSDTRRPPLWTTTWSLIISTWPLQCQKWPVTTELTAWTLVQRNGLDADLRLVETAVVTMIQRGQEHPPSPGQIIAAVREHQSPVLTFEEVWSAIHRAMGAWGSPRPNSAKRQLAHTHLALDLVDRMGGWEKVCLGGGYDADDATHAGVWRSQAEHAYRALVEQERNDVAAVNAGESPLTLQAQDRLRRRVVAIREAREWQGRLLPPAEALPWSPPRQLPGSIHDPEMKGILQRRAAELARLRPKAEPPEPPEGAV